MGPNLLIPSTFGNRSDMQDSMNGLRTPRKHRVAGIEIVPRYDDFGLQSDETESRSILDSAAEAGVTFIDTADVYPARGPVGETETILGRWLSGKRDQYIIASKCAGRTGPRPWDEGCSRKHILAAVEASLRRLGTDYLDLYQLHHYDPGTPIDETLSALENLVVSGKVRYIGCSNWPTFQIALALGRSDFHAISRFTTVQPRYNLLYRAVESELIPLCLDQQLGILAYNPLAGGLLTSKYSPDTPPPSDSRFGLSPVYRGLYWRDKEFEAVDAIHRIAIQAGIPIVTLSIAWLLHQPSITSAILGASRQHQLADSIAGAEQALDPDILAELDNVTLPASGSGF
jgi:aryl-alcohol dehydrogenase-like predicted oxidoreductase